MVTSLLIQTGYYSGQENSLNNSATIHNHQTPKVKEENNIDNVPSANNSQVPEVEEKKMVMILPHVMGLLMLLAEKGWVKLHRQWDKLNEIEWVLRLVLYGKR
ncbi:hypothetical protein EDB19DRAFT_1826265 [Suillus lakei]|nr:hypothetical protein EDB19DRAFT_1826265 [Suillus lakei]